jgi:heme/copper-type cytochrome/quinol oxidase subunit 2
MDYLGNRANFGTGTCHGSGSVSGTKSLEPPPFGGHQSGLTCSDIHPGVARRDTNHMRTIALKVLAIIAASVFVIMMIAVARHRATRSPQTPWPKSALAEYLFELVPWLIMIGSALPSLRRIAAGG